MNLKLIVVLGISHLFVDMTGTGLAAILPFLKDALSLNYTQIGAIIMVSNVTSSIIQPGLGYFSDRIHIGWLLPVSIVLTYGGFSLFGLAPTYALLLVFVIVNGIGIAIYHPESFKTAHFLTGARAATGMSIFQVGGNLGLAVGPLFVTSAMQMAGLRGTLLFLVLGAAIVIMLMIFFRELALPLKSLKQEKGPVSPVSTKPAARSTWLSMTLLVTSVAFRSVAQMGIITFIPFYYISLLGGDAVNAGRLVFAFMMGGSIGTLVGGMAADRIGHKCFVSLSLACSMPLLFLVLYASSTWIFVVLFLAGFVLVSSFSVTVVMGQTLLRDRLGMASGLMLGFVIGIGGLGGGVLGLVADAWGILTVLRLVVIFPAAALILLLFVSYPKTQPIRS